MRRLIELCKFFAQYFMFVIHPVYVTLSMIASIVYYSLITQDHKYDKLTLMVVNNCYRFFIRT